MYIIFYFVKDFSRVFFCCFNILFFLFCCVLFFKVVSFVLNLLVLCYHPPYPYTAVLNIVVNVPIRVCQCFHTDKSIKWWRTFLTSTFPMKMQRS